MFRVMGSYQSTEGHVDISMRDPSPWNGPPGMTGMDMTVILIGDEECGPFLALATVPPLDEPMRRSPAHGHDCDSWRIAIRGQLSMGQRVYGPGEFRFQCGGQPYGADDYAWGDDTGYSVVMMSDRRGPTGRPTNPKFIEGMRRTGKVFYEWLGITVPSEYPGSPGVRTTIGVTNRGGAVEGSFADTIGWTEVSDGVRVAAGLLGDHAGGPVVVLVHSVPGTIAWPTSTIATEVLHLVVAGEAQIGDDTLLPADIRVVEAGRSGEAVIAGATGLSHVVVLGDRRLVDGGLTGVWGELLGGAIDRMCGELLTTSAR